MLAVREDHRGSGEPVNTIVSLDLQGPNADGGTVVCAGADFYANPELCADGRLAWTEWNHPSMPWDATLIRVAELDGTTPGPAQHVAGGPQESAVQPRWTPDGTLVFASDRSGWWNLYAWSAGSTRCLRSAEAEFAGPLWQLGQSPYAVVDDGHLLVTQGTGAAGSIGILAVSTGELSPVAADRTASSSVTVSSGTAAAVLSTPDGPPRLARLDLSTQQWSDVRRASEAVLEPAYRAMAEAVTWSSPDGPVHGWFYPPTNGDYDAPAGTLPPLITVSHGGPTACSGAGFRLAVQYWTSRGIAVLDVNYGGSSGYGRRYRERLKGRWGLVDVDDCAAGAVEMGRTGRADPARLAISGGSAGGYTTLRALTSTDVFAAGISRYGVGDLEGLARDTHKFESRYLDGLVGPYPEAVETYRDRSPVHHVDRLSAPILLLQGADDRVVPPNQAEAMADAARAKGLPVALVVFPGEGHGFRRSENIRASLEAELTFLGRIFDFVPADELPALAIENLPPD
jgi:dipeptidyl aminopeptidase/acylaminoacyl peptidase